MASVPKLKEEAWHIGMKSYLRSMIAPYVLVYTDKIGSRLRYTFDLVFRTLLGMPYQLINDKERAAAHEGPLLVYTSDPLSIEVGLRIKAVDLLFEKGLREQRLAPAFLDDLPVLFRTHQRYDLPFDPFAAIFYLVSRYEEYLPHLRDGHDRFDPAGNLLVELGLLETPLVDRYALLIAVLLRRRWPELPMPNRRYRFMPTVDVDMLYAYREKGIWKTAYGFGKAMQESRWDQFQERREVLVGRQADPFDTFDYLLEKHKKSGGDPVYFFLMGDYGGFDKAHSPFRESFRELVKSTADHFKVGLHPSYRSNSQPSLVDRERKLLEDILNRPVVLSRQHYLKVRLPGTYQQLAKRDFEADFSMAYAGYLGFRSGTATPHLFYDLDYEAPTALMVYPTCVMDITLQQYLALSPEQAKQRIDRLIAEVKAVEGTFVSLWHNSSLHDSSPWQGWRAVYEHLLEQASPDA